MSCDSSKDRIGVYFNGYCVSVPIPNDYLSFHINTKEMYAFLVAVNTFKTLIAERQGIIHIDNKCVVDSFAKKWSKNARIMRCIYLICLLLIQYRCHIFVKYIKTENNFLADLLSRNDIDRFNFAINLLKLKANFNTPFIKLYYDFSLANIIYLNKKSKK